MKTETRGLGIWGLRIWISQMNKIELEMRTKEFSLQLIRFLESLPNNYVGETLDR